MPLTVVSGSHAFSIDQEISGSAPTYLFSPHGPNIAEYQLQTNQLKSDVTDAQTQTVDGAGKVWTLSNCQSINPNAILLRTQLPAHCNKDWSIRLETQFGHAGGGQQNTKFVAFSIAGRIISGMSSSSGKAQNLSGSWTSTNVNYSLNGGLKASGWHPFGKVPDNSGHYALPVPPQPGSLAIERSRFIRLGELVNEAEADDLNSFNQGSILDVAIVRDLDPTRAHGSDPGGPLGNTKLRMHTIKLVFNQFTGSG